MTRAEARLSGNEAAARVTRAELAEAWGVSRAAITRMFHRPGAPEFEGGKISLGVAEAWRSTRRRASNRAPAAPAGAIGDDLDIGEAKRRQEVLRARLLEVEYRRTTADLVPREEVRAAALSDGAAVRADLLALPARLAPELADAAATGGVAAVSERLASALRDVLSAWARLGLECTP